MSGGHVVRGGAARRVGARVVWTQILALLLFLPQAAWAVTDPGPRGGAPGAGDPLPGLTAPEQALFEAGLEEFLQVASVQGEAVVPGTEAGLGPRFNANSCAACHVQPAVGGSSPAQNPQAGIATLGGASNQVPWFVAPAGPVREARFVKKRDGTPDGGVTDLFVVAGRADAPGCAIQQPGFLPAGDPLSGQGGNPNLIFRIPTPTFGGGLIEAIPDQVILDNKASQRHAKALLGISGRENRTGNDGTITRFGWKAQNKSLLLFAAEAYNVEQGITNEIFGQEREEDPGCRFNPLPEDRTAFDGSGADAHSAIVRFAGFMRLLAPPAPAPASPSTANGQAQFARVGCALCHTPTLTTGREASAALSQQRVNLYSDLLLHDMGDGLADGISQGGAGGREFRTAPLWGLGQRLFFLHDGRTGNLLAAIQAHASQGSEATQVVVRFNQLFPGDKQDLIDFLRSL